MSLRVLRTICAAVFVGGIAGLIISSVLDNNGAVLTVGTGVFDLRAAANTRQLVSLSASLTGLAPGEYKVGLCGKSGDASNWNSNEFSYTTALVTQ